MDSLDMMPKWELKLRNCSVTLKFSTRERREMLFLVLSLLKFIGRVYESNNYECFKLNSNERKQPSFFESIMIRKTFDTISEHTCVT